MNEPVLELREIIHSFDQGENSLEVLRGVNLSIMPGEIVALIGPSGSGKSTLLQIAGLLEPPLSGEILLKGKSRKKLNDFTKKMINSTKILSTVRVVIDVDPYTFM